MLSKLLLVGCGKMGEALLTGWLKQGFAPEQITVVEPKEKTSETLKNSYGVKFITSPNIFNSSNRPDVIIFAVKPQIMDEVVQNYNSFNDKETVYLSIAAGKNIAYYEKMLGAETSIVRAMPNTPASVGRGITVCCPNVNVSKKQISICEDLMKSVGEVIWLKDETQIDIVTALSGGGPAYVFLLTECLSNAGIEAGLPEKLAKRLARATVIGSGELLHRSIEDPSTLRENVTSPGGTTAEALRILMAKEGWQSLMNDAIMAATKKSRNLNK